MCIRDRHGNTDAMRTGLQHTIEEIRSENQTWGLLKPRMQAVSYTHLRAHETVLDLVCRLLLEKKKKQTYNNNL